MLQTIQQSVMDTILSWLIDQIGTLVNFLLIVFFFACMMYLAISLLRFQSKSGVEPKPNFFGKSFQASMSIGIVVGIIVGIFVVVIMVAFIAALGGGGSIVSILAVSTIGGLATAITSSDMASILFIVILLAILIGVTGEIMKMIFHVTFWQGMAALILTVALGALVLYLFELGNIQMLMLFQQWADQLETMAFNMMNPSS
jgi:hypothetical protein